MKRWRNDLPVNIDWSILITVDLILVTRMSAGTLSPTRNKTIYKHKFKKNNNNMEIVTLY